MTEPDRLVEFVRGIAESDMARRAARVPRFGTLAADEAIVARLAPERRPAVCPRCRGEQKFNPSPSGDPQAEVDCSLCGGDGEVEAA